MKTENFSLAKNIVLFNFLVFAARDISGQNAQKPDTAAFANAMKAAGNPKAFGPFLKIYAYDHPGIGTYIAPLKDVNQDGFNDFAVSTSTDTTFIFFGGPNLDEQPDGFVLGGGAGLLAGDVDGNGYTDLITSRQYSQSIDPEGKGLVRVYLHNKSSTMYNPEPELKFVGRNRLSALGHGQNGMGHIHGGDVNGDNLYDFVLYSQDLNGVGSNASRGILWIYLGSATPDTIPDIQLIDWNKGAVRGFFGEEFQVTNVNGDQYDDIISRGYTTDSNSSRDESFYLGNQRGIQIQPNKILENIHDGRRFQFLDLNGDGCAELHRPSGDKNPAFAWGFCGDEFLTKQDFIDDTIITNENTDVFPYASSFHQIGDFDGAGYKDFVIVWLVEFMGTPLGLSCYFYQGGPGFHTKALAYYGVPADDYLYGAPYPLGDITGDGIDDFALIASYYQSTITRYWAAIWLFNGDRKLNPTNAVDQTKDTDEFRLSIFPNPVQRGGMVSIQGFESSSGKHALTISDALGREVKREDRFLSEEGAFQFQLDVQRIPSGVYYLTVRSPSKRTVKSLTIVDKR